jgi:hypothetical protein
MGYALFNEIVENGTVITYGGRFLFRYDKQGLGQYAGVFLYFDRRAGVTRMILQIEPKSNKEGRGYHNILSHLHNSPSVNIPGIYSYAKYIDNRLVIYKGAYVYPMVCNPDDYPHGFSVVKEDRHLHFVSRGDNDNVIVITRERRNVYHYLVSFSYLMLFYSGFSFLFIRGRHLGRRRNIRIRLPKNSFRRKITYLITVSLVVSLISMGFGSVWFCLNYYRDSKHAMMEEMLQTVQVTLTDLCKYAEGYQQINTSSVYQCNYSGDVFRKRLSYVLHFLYHQGFLTEF